MSHESSESFTPRINDVAQKCIEELLKEKAKLPNEFPLCSQAIDDAIDRIYATGRIPGKELQADVYKQLPIKVTQNVYLPIKQFPKFNFMGKLIGPKGNTLRTLNQETLCHIGIKGRESMRDQEKEESLRKSGNPAFNHLNKNLFVEISTVAPPAEAYARISYALSEIRKYIIPDKNDEISQEQYRELLQMHPEYAKSRPTTIYKSVFGKMQSSESFRGREESGYGKMQGSEHFRGRDEQEEYDEEYESSPPPPPPNFSKQFGGFRPAAPRRPETSFLERTREYRPKPYQGFQKNSPFKK